MSYPVKFFDSTQTGAPAMNSQAGSLVAILDACLVTGFNLKVLDSISVTAGIATATVSAGHGYRVNDALKLSGANEVGWNVEIKVLTASTTQFTFSAPEGMSSAPTGTVSAKVAPGGWEKLYSATNKGAYRSLDVASSKCLLFVDDSGNDSSRNALVRGYESMSDINTGVGPFPTIAQASATYWRKSDVASSSSARAWAIATDGVMVYLFAFWHASYQANLCDTFCFGDMVSYRASDAFNAMLSASVVLSPSTPGGGHCEFGRCDLLTAGHAGQYIARSFTGIGSAVITGKINGAASSWMGYGASFTYPSQVDNGLHLAACSVYEYSAVYQLRGLLPGIYVPFANKPLAKYDSVSDLAGLPGRTLVALPQACSSIQEGRLFVDITGPWR